MTKQATAAPVYFDAGDYADVDCVNGAGPRGHYYRSDLGGWECCHCGGIAHPQTPVTVQRMGEEVEPAPPPAPRATGVRVQPVDGVPYTVPVVEGSMLAIVPPGTTIQPPDEWAAHSYTFALSGIQRASVLHTKGGA